MAAIWVRVRSEVRARWRAWLALALLIGVAGGASIAAAAGARRTASAYERFLIAQRAADAVIEIERIARPGEPAPGPATAADFDTIAALPSVEAASDVSIVPAALEAPSGRRFELPEIFPLASRDGRFGRTLNIQRFLQGRAPRPGRADEVAVSPRVAQRLGVRVGSTLTAVLRDGDPGPPDLPPVRHPVRVTGIEIAPFEFQPLAGFYIPAVHFTPAFLARYQSYVPRAEADLVVRLHGGERSIPRLIEDARDMGFRLTPVLRQSAQTFGVERSTGFQAVALWLLCALTAAAALAVLGQSLARQAFLESSDYAALRAVGMSRKQLVAAGIARAGGVGAAGALVAVAVAFLASPLMPRNIARLAEPDPGFAFDGAAIGIGAAATLVLVVAVSAYPVWRAARLAGAREIAAGPGRPSTVAHALARAGMPATAVSGVRMALEPGRGPTAVPVRTAILGTTLGIACLAASFVFNGSLQHLLETPELSGSNWDVMVATGEPAHREGLARALQANRRVVDATAGTIQDVVVGGRTVTALVFGRGRAGPSVVEGRAPRGRDEIALGIRSAKVLRARPGDTVVVAAPTAPPEIGRDYAPRSMRVVGTFIVPDIFFDANAQDPDFDVDGVALPLEALQQVRDTDADTFYIMFSPGTSVDRETGALREQFESLFVLPPKRSADIDDLARVADLPMILAALLAAIALGTMAHALVTSIRRKSRDLAILKTLGFVPRQIRATVAWQSTALASFAAIAGLPLGIAAGRWGWRVFVAQFAVVPETVTPVLTAPVIAAVALVLANVVALVPGRMAARMHPARVLTQE